MLASAALVLAALQAAPAAPSTADILKDLAAVGRTQSSPVTVGSRDGVINLACREPLLADGPAAPAKPLVEQTSSATPAPTADPREAVEAGRVARASGIGLSSINLRNLGGPRFGWQPYDRETLKVQQFPAVLVDGCPVGMTRDVTRMQVEVLPREPTPEGEPQNRR